MGLPRWDRIYFFAFSAASFAVLGYLVILVVPLYSVVSSEFEGVQRRTLLAEGYVVPLLVGLAPVVLTAGTLIAIPRDGQPTRSGKINLWLSTFLIYVFVIFTIWSIGIFFFPSAILITAAAVSAQVRRRTLKPPPEPPAQPAQEPKPGRGGGKRRRNRG